ncbi:hypothetical protein J6590_091840 [Homalodisca vitripennis]|nr:hypothetical protein J6590_091840 [Homalodisca vitripennis]
MQQTTTEIPPDNTRPVRSTIREVYCNVKRILYRNFFLSTYPQALTFDQYSLLSERCTGTWKVSSSVNIRPVQFTYPRRYPLALIFDQYSLLSQRYAGTWKVSSSVNIRPLQSTIPERYAGTWKVSSSVNIRPVQSTIREVCWNVEGIL